MAPSVSKLNLLCQKRCLATVMLLLTSSVLSGWMIQSWAQAPAGYAAAYATAGAAMFALTLGLPGSLLLISARTRRLGLTMMFSALWLYASFAIGTSALYHFNLVAWKNEHKVLLYPRARRP
jgi:hypothetical protein